MTLLYSIAIHLFYLAMLLTSLFNKKARLWISGRKARRFIRLVRPDSAYFIKYEFWFFYLKQLHGSGIPAYLISGIFRQNQVFFQWYGSWFRNKLRFFKHFFVQDQASAGLLDSIGFQNLTVSGDTRFDRVTAIAAAAKKMDMAETFTNGSFCIGGGFGKGIHNILEAAAFSIPVIFGPNHHKFREAKELTACRGAFSINNSAELEEIFYHLVNHPDALNNSSAQAKNYVLNNIGATNLISRHVIQDDFQMHKNLIQIHR